MTANNDFTTVSVLLNTALVAPVPPTITSQPASQTVTAGQSATFSVTASGTAPLGYQWQKNNVPISGATLASYTTPATTSADNGAQFTVVVSNSAGTQTSNPAILTVTAAPTFTLSASPSSVTVVQGSSGQSTITVTPQNGFSGSVALSITSTLPSGVTGAFSPTSTTTTSTLTLTATSTATTGGPVTVTITGTSGSLTSTTTISLTMTPPAPTLSSLTLSPSSVTGGSSSTGTVTLIGPAPSGGAVVSLSSSSTSVATVPASVTVPGGGTTATFTVSTSPVGSSTSVTISGSYGGATQTALLSLTSVGVSTPVLMWQYGGCIPGPYCDTGWYSSPAVADLDGDGQPDVIWGNYDVVALNGADGSLKWRGPSVNRVWPSIAVADLTGKGMLEVIVARHAGELTVYDRFGNVVWRRNPFGTGVELRTLAVADLESDGRLEILVGRTSGDQTPQLIAVEPDGTVRPGWPVRHSGEPGYGWGLYNENVVVADMNGDGLKEVFSPTTGHYITAVDRNGNQLPTNAVYNDISPVGPKVWSQVGVHVDNAVDLRGYANCGVDHRPNFQASAPVVADLDGDGVPELIVVGNVYNCGTDPYTSLYQMPFILKLDRTRWSGSGFDWIVIPTPGPGSAPRSEDYNVIENVVPNAVVADLDGDGFKEIIYPSYDGKVHAYWLDKTAHGSWPYTIPTTGAPGDDFRFASEPVVADLDNDGHAEVIFTSWPKKATGGVGQLHILDYLGRELYRIDLPAPAIGSTWNGGLGAPTIANIDADPDLEVVVGTAASGVVAYKLPNTAHARILWGTGRGNYRRDGSR